MITTIVLIVIAAIANAVMDLSTEYEFYNDFWNKGASWRNKWNFQLGYLLEYEKKDWRYLWIFTPKYKERFYLSSTVLVFLTDGWHLSQFVFHSSWQLAIAVNMDHTFIAFIVIKTLFSLIFELAYIAVKN